MLTDSDRERLVAEIELGLDAEAFLGTPVGKYMLERAQDEAMAAFDEIRELKRSEYKDDATYMARFQELQQALKLAELFEIWIAQAIEAGRNMEQTLREADTVD